MHGSITISSASILGILVLAGHGCAADTTAETASSNGAMEMAPHFSIDNNPWDGFFSRHHAFPVNELALGFEPPAVVFHGTGYELTAGELTVKGMLDQTSMGEVLLSSDFTDALAASGHFCELEKGQRGDGVYLIEAFADAHSAFQGRNVSYHFVAKFGRSDMYFTASGLRTFLSPIAATDSNDLHEYFTEAGLGLNQAYQAIGRFDFDAAASAAERFERAIVAISDRFASDPAALDNWQAQRLLDAVAAQKPATCLSPELLNSIAHGLSGSGDPLLATVVQLHELMKGNALLTVLAFFGTNSEVVAALDDVKRIAADLASLTGEALSAYAVASLTAYVTMEFSRSAENPAFDGHLFE